MLRLGEMLKRYRQHANMKQIDMAEEIGISPGQLSSIEHGNIPSAEALLLVQGFVFAVSE